MILFYGHYFFIKYILFMNCFHDFVYLFSLAFHSVSLADNFEFFVRQIIDLHFFRVSYWSYISFHWWYQICLILHELCSLALVSLYL